MALIQAQCTPETSQISQGVARVLFLYPPFDHQTLLNQF